MRHRREVGDDRLAADILAEDDRQLRRLAWNSALPMISCSTTDSRFALGSSMPITVRPGIVATRAESADMLRAISSAGWITRLALMPGAGSSSYMVTTGPGGPR